MRDLIVPNAALPKVAAGRMALIWLGFLGLVWTFGRAAFLPSPLEVLQAFPRLWNEEGLGEQLWTSFTLDVEAVALMAALSLALAYATVMPAFRSLADIVASGRFNGFVGFPLIFMSLLHNPHRVKVALLVFGMGVFTVLSLVKMIHAIPKELFDHSRTLRMSEWRVVWEVVVLGRADEAIDILQINAAMGWMMMPMVEGLFKFEGGVGALMEVQSKHLQMDAVFCTLFVILLVGMALDWSIGTLKKIACPYAAIGMERQ